jgi:putative ABC transport system ATP-binding protein
MNENIITTKDLVKTFTDGDRETKVLKGVTIEIKKGEFVAIMGRSGAGKSTMLYQVGLLDTPTGGEITIEGVDIHNLTEEERIDFRLSKLGYVFQDYALLPDLTSRENVALPLLMQGIEKSVAYARADEMLDAVGLEGKYDNTPPKLSGGQQQRVSIARALAHNPAILFADEPTANLDTESSMRVLKIFQEIHTKGQTIVMVTHEAEYAKVADRVIMMVDGMVHEN